MDPYLHERMVQVVGQGKKLRAELDQLQKLDIPKWQKRIEFAASQGQHDLSRQAAEHCDGLLQRAKAIEVELELLRAERDQLRFQSAVAPGREVVERTEAMVDAVRIGGLVDPDKAKMENELRDLPTFDFGDKGKP